MTVHCYKPYGHVITGDLNIVTNNKLRQLFQYGPKYREPPTINWNYNFKIIMDAAETYAKKWASVEDEDVECLSDWLRTVRDKVQKRISRLRSSYTVIKTTSSFDDSTIRECLDALHDKYVVVPADKASNNIIFVCKQFYIQCLMNELKINSGDSNTTYCPSSLSKQEIFDNHSSVLNAFGIKLSNDDNVLPRLYWIPKIHKNPYKQRFIAGCSRCTTKRLSQLLTTILSTIKSGLVRYCDKVYETSGINQMWILKNSKELLHTLDTNKSKYGSIRTFDFSTLYTTIPHNKLKTRLSSLVKQAFFYKNGSRRYDYIVIKHNSGYFSNNSDAKCKYTDTEVIKMLHFLIDNIYVSFAGMTFRQTIGIPMGTNCAPLLADLFLYSYEAEFMQTLHSSGSKRVAKSFNNTYRYIDDLISLNNPGISNYLHHIYPDELEIKETTESMNSASYLDLFIEIRHNAIHTKLYDKRDDFNFEIINFPYLTSNIPSSPAYGVYISQLLRYCRACDSYGDFQERHSLLVLKLVRQGFSQTCCRMIEEAMPYAEDRQKVPSHLYGPRLPASSIYVLGGYLQSRTGGNCPHTLTIERYDINQDQWKEMGKLPFNLECQNVVSVNGEMFFVHKKLKQPKLKIPTFTNVGTVHTLCTYNVIQNGWKTKEISQYTVLALLCSFKQSAVAVCKDNNVIYVCGGKEPTGSFIQKSVLKLDIENDEWSQLPNLPELRYNHSAIVVDRRLYVIGGNDVSVHIGNVRQEVKSSVVVYDPDEDCWLEKRNMNTPRLGLGLAAVDGYIYAIGGISDTARQKTVERYDPNEDTWTYVSNMHKQRSFLGVATCNNLIYAIGGKSYSNDDGGARTVLNSAEVYDPIKDEWRFISSMKTPRCMMSVSVL